MNAYQGLLLASSFGLPLAAALALAIRDFPVLLRAAPLAPLPAIAAALALAPEAGVDIPWLLLGTRLGLDATADLFLLFTGVVWLIAGWYARAYVPVDDKCRRFWIGFLATQAGNIGVCVAQDGASFYLFFTLMTFAAYMLVVHSASQEAYRAGRIYLVMAVLGEAALVAGILLLAHAAGGHSFAALAAARPPPVAAALIVIGFGIKVGVPLLHLWLPLAHPVAPVPASAVLSGVILKAGLLGWLRYLPLGEYALPQAGAMLLGLGLLAMFYGVAIGVTQSNAKVVLAYSSISQMGFMTVGVGAGLIAPALWPQLLPAIALYACHHALAKSALFLGVGVVASRPGNKWILAALSLPALALAGLTFTSGALVKTGLKYALDGLPAPWATMLDWLLPLAAVGTTLLLTHFLLIESKVRASGNVGPRGWGLLAPWLVLLLGVALFTRLLAPPDATEQLANAAALWNSTWPVAAGITIAWLAWRLSLHRLPAVAPGDLVVPIEHAIAAVRRLTERLSIAAQAWKSRWIQ